MCIISEQRCAVQKIQYMNGMQNIFIYMALRLTTMHNLFLKTKFSDLRILFILLRRSFIDGTINGRLYRTNDDAMKVNSSLRIIYLKSDYIGAKGACKDSNFFYRALIYWRIIFHCNCWCIESEYFSAGHVSQPQNNLGDQGAGKILEALKLNCSLQSIYLGSNTICKNGTEMTEYWFVYIDAWYKKGVLNQS